MYEVKNGILYKDGKRILCLGAAYFASFHERKVAIPTDTPNRAEEMKRDIRDMQVAGFNLIRTAALGKLEVGEQDATYSGEFIDEMLDLTEELDMAALMRIQGYSMRSKAYTDAGMVEAGGTAYDGSFSLNFLNDSLHHPGILSDNEKGTKAIAAHFKDRKNIVGFLSYNEPHYPGKGVYDYNEYTIKAYRQWLKDNDIKLAEDIENYQPPRKRPVAGESIEEWMYWRLFSTEAMSAFINGSAALAKAVSPRMSSLTCMTPNMLEFDNFIKGCDYFASAEGMDVMGITLYKNSGGGDYYTTDMIINSAEAAAAVQGKHLWMVEQDAATDISIPHFKRQTYMALGAGVKALVWYQWRADYPYDDAPEANGFGFVYNDRTKTPDYDEKIGLVKYLNQVSDYVVNAEKHRDGVGIFYSQYATLYCDAVENIHEKAVGMLKNTYATRMRMYYAMLKKENVSADMIRAKDLAENRLGIRLLFVPEFKYLSKEEQAQVLDFQAKGGKVFVQAYDRWQAGMEKFGFDELGTPVTNFNCCYEISEVLEYAGIQPVYGVLDKKPVGVNVLEGENYLVLSVVNISRIHTALTDVKIKLNTAYKTATLTSPEGESVLEIKDGIITIPTLTDGVFVIVK
ncbi:MAG: beta-galactosidase [Clostridia bacterium]|nr:beta-galactosidase [Clostridia bacterium]